MKVRAFLVLCVPAVIGISTVAASAETYTETTVQSNPGGLVETREGVIEAAPTVIREEPTTTTTIIREQPVITEPVIVNERVIEKRSHHLIKVGPVKVF